MNKLIVEEEIFLQDEQLNFNTSLDKLIINVQGNCIINEFNNDIKELILNLQTNSSLIYNRFRLNPQDSKLIINQQKKVQITYNEAIKNQTDFNYQIISNLDYDEIKSHIYLRIINEKFAKTKIDILGKIAKNIEDVSLLEDLRGLVLNDSQLSIIPNMEVLANNISANHNVVIGTINQDELLYLTSKGLKEDTALELLKKAFILNIFTSEEKEIIKKYL